jgi:hypothetical protein
MLKALRPAMFSLGVAVAALAMLPAVAQTPKNDAELAELVAADQADRRPSAAGIDWSVVALRDADRRARVLEVLNTGRARTSDDFYAAALVFQHGDSLEDAELAYSLATVAARLKPTHKAAAWLTAAAWDRLLMRQGKPQWWGTQFVQMNESGRIELYQVDESAVTDAMRAARGVPSLAEAKARAEKMNASQK